jgi:hypothetical protein
VGVVRGDDLAQALMAVIDGDGPEHFEDGEGDGPTLL